MSAAQGMEEKVLDHSMEALISRSREVKSALEQFLLKIEHEHATLTWPSVLDSFALLSGQMSSLFALLQSEKISPLQNYQVIPLRLGQDDDPFLANLTEGRLMSLNHAAVPDHLRTKPDPEVEQIDKQMTQEANSIYNNETMVKTLNKQCEKMLDKIKVLFQNWKTDQLQLKNIEPTFNVNDTMQLITAANYGKDIGMSSAQVQLQPGGGKLLTNAGVKMQSHAYPRS